MLDNETRKLFKKWKLYEKEWPFYTVVCYESPTIRVERLFEIWDKAVYTFLLDLFFDFEYRGQKIWVVDLGRLTGLDHTSITKITHKAIKKMWEEAKRREEETNKQILANSQKYKK